jgi:hypothetical protein
LEQYLTLRQFYYGDYYPLTAYSQARDLWMAYQLDRSDQGKGLVVVLRRPESPYETARFPLRGLKENARSQITNLDTGEARTRSGKELLQTGLEVIVQTRPGSALVTYEQR